MRTLLRLGWQIVAVAMALHDKPTCAPYIGAFRWHFRRASALPRKPGVTVVAAFGCALFEWPAPDMQTRARTVVLTRMANFRSGHAPAPDNRAAPLLPHSDGNFQQWPCHMPMQNPTQTPLCTLMATFRSGIAPCTLKNPVHTVVAP